MANCHVSYSAPNFGIQEFAVGWHEAVREIFSASPVYADGHVTIHDLPGLGIDVNQAAARKHPALHRSRPAIRRSGGSAWPY